MANTPDDSPWAGAVAELMDQASAVLDARGGRVMGAAPATAPAVPAGALPVPYVAETLLGIAGRVCPVTGAAVPASPPDKNRIRQQAHELIEALLGTLGQSAPAPEPAAAHYDQVPLIRCAAPVEPGATASVAMKVANDEHTPAEVSLYCTNFITDSGHEIPALRVTVSPRRTTVPARGEVQFDISIAVPAQTPRGLYSGLLQATGCTYVKAVITVQVL
jgi:hypothetical protein